MSATFRIRLCWPSLSLLSTGLSPTLIRGQDQIFWFLRSASAATGLPQKPMNSPKKGLLKPGPSLRFRPVRRVIPTSPHWMDATTRWWNKASFHCGTSQVWVLSSVQRMVRWRQCQLTGRFTLATLDSKPHKRSVAGRQVRRLCPASHGNDISRLPMASTQSGHRMDNGEGWWGHLGSRQLGLRDWIPSHNKKRYKRLQSRAFECQHKGWQDGQGCPKP